VPPLGAARVDTTIQGRSGNRRRFPRIWVVDAENRDLQQLLWHRHRLVQMRTRIMNRLLVVALNEGVRRKNALWRPAGVAKGNRWCWRRGPAGVARIGSTYSTNWRRRSRNWRARWKRSWRSER